MSDASEKCDVEAWLWSHPATWSEAKLMEQCKMTFGRASGPGGQNRNKVETSVVLEYLPDAIMAKASERRTQSENRKTAIQRLRCKLAAELRPSEEMIASLASTFKSPTDRGFVSEVWRAYCRDGRVDIAETNWDWPSVLAELVGLMWFRGWDIGTVAGLLETSASQLVKLLKKEPAAFKLFNRERASRGLGLYR
jgi:hypothetical protein